MTGDENNPSAFKMETDNSPVTSAGQPSAAGEGQNKPDGNDGNARKGFKRDNRGNRNPYDKKRKHPGYGSHKYVITSN